MSEAKPTAAPWAAVHDGHGNFYVNGDNGDGDCLATIGRLEDGKDNERREKEMLANWRLMAAAPELLDACEMALRDFEEIVNKIMVPAMKVHPFTLTPAQLRAAIAKARSGEWL